jgi:16S rRNA (adenine1518-N6/adenine1519-N6)-dimethyltransferase
VRPRKRFGQHFLASVWADKVVEAIGPSAGERFLEIGPGPGVLTLRLAARAAHVTAVEIDRDLAADLRRSAPPNVEVLTGDFLDVDLAAHLPPGPIRVAGNLPYNISSPILFRLLAEKRGQSPFPTEGKGDRPRFVDATLMLQREVVDRLVARPGTKDYGTLAIFASAEADVRRVLTLPPGAFRPAPKVHSAVVRLIFTPSRVPNDLWTLFEGMVRSTFTQRRKTLLNALRAFAASVGSDAAAALTDAGVDPAARPETLGLDALVALASALRNTAAKA